jgi:hypothetical protein
MRDGFELDVMERLAYQVLAWQDLRNPAVGGVLDAEGILELCRAAGFSEEESQKAATRQAYERIKKGHPA